MDKKTFVRLFIGINILKINAEDINTVSLPKDLYDILLSSFRQDNEAPDIHDIARRLTVLETKNSVYTRDRNQFLDYFKVTTDVLERLRIVEEQNEALKQSLYDTQSTMQEIKTKMKELADNMQVTEEIVNASRQKDSDHEKISADVRNLHEDIIHTKNQHFIEFSNLTGTVGDIRNELENTTNFLLKCDRNIKNLTAVIRQMVDQNDVEATERGFYAQLNREITNLGNNQVIVFGRTITDIGRRYNNKTGVFSCDVPGTYLFYTNLMTLTSGYLEAEIVVNGNSVSMIYSVGVSSHHGQGSNLAILALDTGDSVWIRVHDRFFHGNPRIHSHWSTFSGYLLRASVV